MSAESYSDASVEDVIAAACAHFQVEKADLIGPDRHKPITLARHVAMYVCKARLRREPSFPDLGRAFGNRDHSSVMAAVRKIEAQRSIYRAIAAHIADVEAAIDLRVADAEQEPAVWLRRAHAAEGALAERDRLAAALAAALGHAGAEGITAEDGYVEAVEDLGRKLAAARAEAAKNRGDRSAGGRSVAPGDAAAAVLDRRPAPSLTQPPAPPAPKLDAKRGALRTAPAPSTPPKPAPQTAPKTLQAPPPPADFAAFAPRPLADITDPRHYFHCERWKSTIAAEDCGKRLALAEGDTRRETKGRTIHAKSDALKFTRCAGCPVGAEVRVQLRRKPAA